MTEKIIYFVAKYVKNFQTNSKYKKLVARAITDMQKKKTLRPKCSTHIPHRFWEYEPHPSNISHRKSSFSIWKPVKINQIQQILMKFEENKGFSRFSQVILGVRCSYSPRMLHARSPPILRVWTSSEQYFTSKRDFRSKKCQNQSSSRTPLCPLCIL